MDTETSVERWTQHLECCGGVQITEQGRETFEGRILRIHIVQHELWCHLARPWD